MKRLFSYRDTDVYIHHTLDEHPEPEQFAIHAHEWPEVLYCISGSGSYMIEGVQYPMEPHDIFITRPGEMHKLTVDPNVPYERIAVHFSPKFIEAADPEKSLLTPFNNRALGQHNRYTLDEDPDKLLRTPFAGFTFKDVPNVKLNLLARLLMFLTQLDGHFKLTRQQIPFPEEQNELLAYVNKHLFEDISVQMAADAMHLSRSQVSRIFQQVTGTSMWKYVTAKRLLAARAMIHRGESANAACIACGFSEYSSFYRAYRSYFGHSPKEDTKSPDLNY